MTKKWISSKDSKKSTRDSNPHSRSHASTESILRPGQKVSIISSLSIIYGSTKKTVFWKRLGECEFPKLPLAEGRKGCDSRKMWFCLGPSFLSGRGWWSESFLFSCKTTPKPNPLLRNKEQQNNHFPLLSSDGFLSSVPSSLPLLRWNDLLS